MNFFFRLTWFAAILACVHTSNAIAQETVKTKNSAPQQTVKTKNAIPQETVKAKSKYQLFGEDTKVDASLFFEVGPEYYSSNDDNEFRWSLFAQLNSAFHLSKNLSIVVTGILFGDEISFNDDLQEDNSSYDLSEQIKFETHNIHLRYETRNMAAYVGQFNPNFGTKARFHALGKYGYDNFVYDLVGKIGFGGSYVYDAGDLGRHRVSASIFDDVDSSFEDLSFALGLDGPVPISNVKKNPLIYHIGVASGFQNDDNTTNGVVLSLRQINYPLTPDLKLNWLVEAAYVNNIDDTSDDAFILTAAAALNWNQWRFAASYSFADFDDRENAEDDDIAENTLGLAIGYEFRDIGVVSLLYRYSEDEGLDSNTIALTFSKYINLTPDPPLFK